MHTISLISSAAISLLLPFAAFAQNHTSAYTKLIFDRHCEIIEQYEAGIEAKCTGYTEPGNSPDQQWPIYFSDGDLRQMVRFGHTSIKPERWESFGEFNQVGETIEWRLNGTRPVAAILRWYIENTNPQTGMQNKQHRGQVLVVSTVASSDRPHNACVVGYVDARSNKNANELARNIADSLAEQFRCGIDLPEFYGKRGDLSGNPTSLSR